MEKFRQLIPNRFARGAVLLVAWCMAALAAYPIGVSVGRQLYRLTH